MGTSASATYQEVFLVLNGYQIDAGVDEQERLMLDVAAGVVDRTALAKWLSEHLESAS